MPWTNVQWRPEGAWWNVSKMTRRKNVTFVEVTDDAVWDVTVKSDGHIIGHIFRVGELYAYYPGSFNAFTAAFDDSNLERLKERIVTMP